MRPRLKFSVTELREPGNCIAITAASHPPSDPKLLARHLRGGCERSFATLMDAHQRMVLGTALRRTGDAELACDVKARVVCRWEEQTSKGTMWRDIGLGEWLFNLDNPSEIPGIVPAVLALGKEPAAAKAKAMKAKSFVLQRQCETMQTLAKSL